MPLSNSLNSSFVGSFIQDVQDVHLEEDVSTRDIFKKIAMMAVPLSLAQLAQFLIVAVLIALVGQLGVHELGGTSLAFGLINATAFSFATGFCGALETVLSHSFGRDPTSKMYGIYAQRMGLVLLITSACIAPVLAFIDRFLLLIGQHEDVVHFTGIFCRIAMWGIIPAMMLELMRRYYACQQLSTPLSINLVVAAVINPFLLLLLIHFAGYAGAPLAWVLLMTGMSGSLFAYLLLSGIYKQTWSGLDELAYHNIWPLMKLALPSMGMILSEWVALEVNCISAGFSTPEGLAGFTVMYQISGLLWSNASGIYIASSVLVGNAIGKGNPQLSRRVAYCSLVATVVVAVANLFFLLATRNYLPYLFTNDAEVVHIFHGFLPFYTFYHLGDTIQSTMMGILRGCGLQKIGAVCINIVYSIVGVPLGIALFFGPSAYQRDVRALWIGPTVGVAVIGLPMYALILLRFIKWNDLRSQAEDEDHATTLNEMKEQDARSFASWSPNDIAQPSDVDIVAVHPRSPSRIAESPNPSITTPGSAK